MSKALQTKTQPPHVSWLALARAAGRAVISFAGIDDALSLLSNAEAETRAERFEYYLRALAGEAGVPPERFAHVLADALQGKEGPTVRAAVVESARAAIDAVDEAAIFYIARLTHRFRTTSTPEPWQFRALIAALKRLDADMIEALRAATLVIWAMGIGPNGVPTTVVQVGDDPTLVWTAETTFFGGDPVTDTRRAELYRGDVVRRLALALNGESAGVFSGRAALTWPHFNADDHALLMWLFAEATVSTDTPTT